MEMERKGYESLGRFDPDITSCTMAPGALSYFHVEEAGMARPGHYGHESIQIMVSVRDHGITVVLSTVRENLSKGTIKRLIRLWD